MVNLDQNLSFNKSLYFFSDKKKQTFVFLFYKKAFEKSQNNFSTLNSKHAPNGRDAEYINTKLPNSPLLPSLDSLFSGMRAACRVIFSSFVRERATGHIYFVVVVLPPPSDSSLSRGNLASFRCRDDRLEKKKRRFRRPHPPPAAHYYLTPLT